MSRDHELALLPTGETKARGFAACPCRRPKWHGFLTDLLVAP